MKPEHGSCTYLYVPKGLTAAPASQVADIPQPPSPPDDVDGSNLVWPTDITINWPGNVQITWPGI